MDLRTALGSPDVRSKFKFETQYYGKHAFYVCLKEYRLPAEMHAERDATNMFWAERIKCVEEVCESYLLCPAHLALSMNGWFVILSN